ncbi:hypothetical protein AMTRI_Chr11g94660 [Amborella trichopoda]
MSTDSDDIDEDELLQIALREQAQRELPYQRLSSATSRPSRPVVNLIQPPPPPPPPHPSNKRGGANPKARDSKNARRAMEDDDDSEVELLSISSGDEDSSLRDKPVAKAGGHGRKGGRDEPVERGWDGEEPNSWKRVDEAELGRRVREMREARAAPIAQSHDLKAAAMARKGLTSLQSLPRGVDFKFMYHSEKFDAKLFLSRIHQNTGAADLESGALALKTDLRGRTQQKKQLVKENFECFVSCKTTIDDIQSKLKRIEEDPEGAGTAHLYNYIQDVNLVANSAFQPLFERQVQAEKIRSVQGMLQRFRTLFNLPSAIRGSISKGEYDLAVREYRKAKSIVLPSHVGILKRVLEEVEKVMQEFKSMLYRSMEDPQIDLADLENTVRLLLELEPDSDPVWHYLNIQNRRIRGLFERCTIEHDGRMEALHSQLHEKVLSDARWRQIQQDSNKTSAVDYSLLLGDNLLSVDAQPTDLTGEEMDALRGRYICRLTAVLIHHVPAFWRLALSIFHGKFAKSSQVAADSVEPNGKATTHKTEDRFGEMKCSSHSLDEVAEMVQGTVLIYETKVHNTFRDLEESNVLHPHMRDAIKEVSKACHAFEGKEAAPPSAVKSLLSLHMEITKIFVLRICSWMRAATEEISREELWVPVSILERSKSPYTISFLPLAFSIMLISAMDQVDLMVKSLKSETTISGNMTMRVQEMQESVRLAFLNCFIDFTGYLERIGRELSQNRSNKDSLSLQNGYLPDSEGKYSGLHPGSVVTDSHQKLLIVLSNIGYCKEQLSRELYTKYKHIWITSRENDSEGESDIRDLVISFTALEEKVLAHYTYGKANLIRSAASTYLLDGGVHWGGAPAVKGVRDAAVELLHTLVAVHAEVYAGAKPYLEKMLSILVEGLIDTFLSLFHENKDGSLKSLDTNGFCQLMLELEYFETILHAYFTPDAREALNSLKGLLLEKASESTETVENPGHNRRPTRGSEEALMDDKQTVSPDDLIAMAQQFISDLLEVELERTHINISCFMESSLPLESVPQQPPQPTYPPYRGSLDSPSRNYRGSQPVGSPGFSRHRHR